MKRLIIALSSIALVLGMAQCRKNVNQVTPVTPEGTINVSLTAGYDDGSKTDISIEGLVTWSVGDKLYVVGNIDGCLGSLTLDTEGYNSPSNKALFKGNITAWTEAQDLHFYYVGKNKTISNGDTEYSYDISQQNGTLENIVGNMHLAHGIKHNVTVGETKLGSVAMHNMMSIAKFDISGYTAPMKCCGTTTLRSAKLDLRNASWTSTTTCTSSDVITLTGVKKNFYEYYMALIPSETEQAFTFKQNDSDENPVAKPRVIEAGKFYTGGTSKDGETQSIAIKTRVQYTLPGLFSVSDSKKVRFSYGNLYTITIDGNLHWYFEANQYDYRTHKPGGSTGWKAVEDYEVTTTKDWHFGLFGWSSDGTGASAGYLPYGRNTSTTANDYKGSFVDWGKNPIENAENVADQWQTLTKDEFDYLLNSRVTTSGVRFARAFFGGIDEGRALFIFPDNWDNSIYTVPAGSINSSTAATGNFTVTKDTWEKILEPAGVVALPMCHFYRNGTSKGTSSSYFNIYWTATSDPDNLTKAYGSIFNGEACGTTDRKYGHHVRLVKEEVVKE